MRVAPFLFTYMPLNEDRANQLRQLLQLMNDSLTKQDFVRAFRGIVDYVKRIEDQNSDQLLNISETLNRLNTALQNNTKLSFEVLKDEVTRQVNQQLFTLESELSVFSSQVDQKLAEVDKKMSEVRNGKDADEQSIIQQVLAKLPEFILAQAETPESLVEKLQSIEGAWLDASAIKNLPQQTTQHFGGSRYLQYMADVKITDIADGEVLAWDADLRQFVNTAAGGVGVTDGDKGDITVSNTGATWTIDNDVVTYAKMQNVSATNRILGRITAGAGDVEELTGDNVRTITGLATTDSPQFAGINLGHASDTTLTRTGAGVVAIEGVEVVTVSASQTLTGKTINADNNTITNIGSSEITADIITGLTEETTIAAGDFIMIYDASAGALRKMQRSNFVAGLGGGGLSDGDYGDITVGGTGTTMTIDNDVVTYAKIQNVSATSRILGRITAGAGDIEELTAANVFTILGITASAAELNITDGLTVTTAELNYVSGVTSAIQTQLNGKASTALSNLASVAINTSLISDTDVTDDLGSQAIRWNNVYAATLSTGDTAADTLKLRGYDVNGTTYIDILTITANNTVTADLHSSVTINGAAIAYAGGAFHDGFSDFVADEHIAHSGVTLTAGNGLTGGGDISASRSFAVGAGTGITVNADDVAVNQGTAFAWTAAHTHTVAGNTARFINNTDNASVQVVRFEGDRATMADNDEAYISLMLSDDGGTQTEFGRLTWVATDVNAGTSVDGQFEIDVMIAGALTQVAAFSGSGLNLAASDALSFGGVVIISDSAGTTTLSNIDAIDATTKATIEAAIDTLANLTSIQGRTVTLADAGADALLGWDDSASAYQNLSAADARAALGLATTDSPQFTALNIGHASDTTLARVSAGVISVEGKTLVNLTDGGTFLADISVPDEAYDATAWNGSVEVPTKNAIRDKFESFVASAAESTSKSITQASHGFAVGDVLKYSGSVYAKAQADSTSNAEVVGIVSAVADVNTFTLTNIGYVSGLSGLTANTTYYLSPSSAGALTSTEPSTAGQISKPLFRAISTTAGYFFNWRGIVIGEAVTGQEKKSWAVPGMGVVESATFTVDAGGEVPVVLFADGSNNHQWHTTYRVPSVANGLSISNIRIHYRYIGTTDRNLYLVNRVRKYPATNDSARVNDSDTSAYATGTGTDTNHKYIDMVSAAYNGIGTLATGDILTVTINRQGADALDTYGQRFEVLMVEITYA